MTTASIQFGTTHPSKGLQAGLWITQALLSVTFVGTGVWKLLTPIPKLAAMIPWAGDVVALSLFVVWGRRSRAPIPPRS